MPVISYREALNQAMREEMDRDPDVFIMGEEVGHYNGAYKVTQGLLQRFSERRVVDAPIAEMGFAGIGVGAAMVGLRPIIEFITFNFSLVAIDQIVNNAAKIYQMSGGQYHIPIVFRGPGGPAVQVGSQHSQSLESYYAHVPGLKVVMPSTALDAKADRHTPMLAFAYTQPRVERAFRPIVTQHALTNVEAGKAAACAVALLIHNFQQELDPAIAFGIATWGFIEGTKTAPWPVTA